MTADAAAAVAGHPIPAPRTAQTDHPIPVDVAGARWPNPGAAPAPRGVHGDDDPPRGWERAPSQGMGRAWSGRRAHAW